MSKMLVLVEISAKLLIKQAVVYTSLRVNNDFGPKNTFISQKTVESKVSDV